MVTKLLKADEVASILDVSKSYVYQLIRTGVLPALKFGTAVRVKPEDLEQYLQVCSGKGPAILTLPPMNNGKKQ